MRMERVGVVREETVPDSKSPRRGPPATTTMKTPWRRPRISSGAATCIIVLRKIIETVSAQPAAASRSRPSGRLRTSPKAAMARPQAATEVRTATPWRWMRPIQPEKRPPARAPTAGAAASRPTVPASPP
ncbi:hypothetical protein OU787_25245 [Kitasatospora sp. YST-16]|nr:hypothetical protein [Kitasatospora sp. YST-16]WAL74506.1 hypothetical protein OU787_25245 [Kitasatospora sp. YST-16]